MADIQKLEKIVRERYEKKDPNRAQWCDWMYANHVIEVADHAEKLAHRFNAPTDLSRAAALLHDIADSEMKRENPDHEKQSLLIAKQVLDEADFSESEKADILSDALPFHSCHGDDKPKTMVGKILATADALAHLNTEFYRYFNDAFSKERTEKEARQIARSKIERDFNKKIAFPEIQEEVKERYQELLTKYG